MSEVGCAGILVADTFCGPMRELPCEGQLLAVDDLPSHAGGCAANVAIDLARQGLAVDVCGCLGRDAAAGMVRGALEEANVRCEHLTYTDREPTSKTVVLVVEGQDRRYIHAFGANKAFAVEHIPRSWLATLKVFYLGGLFVLPGIDIAKLAELLKFCRERKVVTVVDVVAPQALSGMAEIAPLLPHIDYFLPNDDEAERMTLQRDPLDQARAFLAAGARTVIITRGKEGVVAARAKQYWRCGTHAVNVVDPSGSGDAFAAGVIAGIAAGWAMPELLRFGSALGASATQAVGTTGGVFTMAQAQEFMAAHPLQVSCGELE